MARRAEYLAKIPRAVKRLRSLQCEWITKYTIRDVFEVSRWSADRILQRCEKACLDWNLPSPGEPPRASGSTPPKERLINPWDWRRKHYYLYRRKDVIEALERLRLAESPEIARRGRLARSLEASAESARLRSVVVAPAGTESDNLRAARELPAGVTLVPYGALTCTPGRLTIEFDSRSSFLAVLGRLIFALQNEPEEILARVSDV